MMNVKLQFHAGPMRGDRHEVNLGTLVVGREPQIEGGETSFKLAGATQAISRSHFKLIYRLGCVYLQNLSANGTKIEGKVVFEEQELAPGTVVEPEEGTRITLSWTPLRRVGAYTDTTKEAETSTSVLNSGPLASPLVRIILAVYLLAIVGLAVWLSQGNSKTAYNAEEIATLIARYEVWANNNYDEKVVAAKLDVIDKRTATLQVLLSQGDRRAARVICRELMAVDGSIKSPLYQYAATCLSKL